MAVLDQFSLAGKKALVTGASRGLGQAMAIALAQAGADIALNGRSEERLQETAEAIKAVGRSVVLVPADVSDETQANEMVETAHKELGGLDILVNNAGVWKGTYFFRLKKADWDQVLQTNMTGVFLVAKAAARLMMKQRSGKIINTASVLGLRGSPQAMAYCAAKGAVVQMTRVMAIEMGPAGVQVNAIAPGLFETEMTQQYFKSDGKEALEAYLSRIPSKRCGQPEELGGLVVFLASGASNHVTGQIIAIDGGESLV